tara:strand:+ start:132 stop:500 length:369 start_codon:yes stop_codon:yes gene_type:complete
MAESIRQLLSVNKAHFLFLDIKSVKPKDLGEMRRAILMGLFTMMPGDSTQLLEFLNKPQETMQSILQKEIEAASSIKDNSKNEFSLIRSVQQNLVTDDQNVISPAKKSIQALTHFKVRLDAA